LYFWPYGKNFRRTALKYYNERKMKMAAVKFVKSLTKAQYEALQTKDADTLYFPSDENEIYLGDRKISGDGQAPIASPTLGNLVSMDAAGQVTNAGVAVSTDEPDETSADDKIPTAKAVADAISTALTWG
jgi:hypothetical protein